MAEVGAKWTDGFESQRIALCKSDALVNSGEAQPFDVLYCGQSCLAFAIPYADQVHAYLNRCSHVPANDPTQVERW